MDIEDFEGEDFTYWYGIASLVAVPMIFVVLSLVVAPLWSLCRCCKCCCCKLKEPKNDITSCQIYTPFFLVFACIIAIIAMAAIGYGANVDFSGALLFNDGTGEDGNLYDVAETLMVDTSSKMNVILNITMELRYGIVSAVEGVQEILGDTSVLSVGSMSLISTLYNVSALWGGYVVTSEYEGEQYSFECEFCSSISETIQNITVEIDSQIGPIFEDLDDTVSEIEGSLVDVENETLHQMDLFIDVIAEVRDGVENVEEAVTDSREQVETHNGHREMAYNVVFAIPLISIIYLLFGGVLKKPVCFTMAYCYLWFSCTLMWALLAVHLPIAVLLNDSCDFLDIVDQNVSDAVGEDGQVMDACLAAEPLADTLGLSGYLNFTEVITFPSLGNISEQFQFEQLTAFEDEAFSTNFTTFYSEGDEALLIINNLTALSPRSVGEVWSRDNISALNSTWYYPSNSTEATETRDLLDDLQGLLLAEEATLSAFADTISKIQANLSAVNDQAYWLQQDVQGLVNNVENASDLLNPLFDSVHDMEEAAECGFVGDAYYDTKAVMCSAVLGSLARIVVAMFVIAVLSMFGCMWSIQLVRRVHWWQEQKRQEKDDKLQQAVQPKKPSIILMRQPQGYQQPGYGYSGPQL